MKHKTEDYFIIPEVQKVGIYAIRNKRKDKYYIGSSVNVYKRMLTHAQNILKYGGINIPMIEDLKELKDFSEIEFFVIKTFENGTITDLELREKEWKMIRKYDSVRNGYNKAGTHTNGRYKENEKLYCPIFEKKKEGKQSELKYDRITILRKAGEKAELEKIAIEKGYKNLTQFVNACIDEKVKRIKK